jgi:hypothetical protein
VIIEATSLASLHATFPHQCCVVLVAQWSALLAESARDDETWSPVGAQRIVECLAGWDGVLLLSNDAADPLLSETVRSRLAPRLGVALSAEVGHAPWRREFGRVVAAAVALPPVRRLVPETVWRAVSRLPSDWQPSVHEYLRAPGGWTVKRLVSACGVDRRTLERGFRRAGMPSPAALLLG